MRIGVNSMAVFLVFSISSMLIITSIVLASPTTWNEVTRFVEEGLSGTWFDSTRYFTCDYYDWRIRWEYTPNSDVSLYLFQIRTKWEDGRQVDFFQSAWEEDGPVIGPQGNGTQDINGKPGTFYMELLTLNIESFTIIIEQDLESIPEFPSLIILPMLSIATLLALMYKRKHSVS